MDKYLNITDDDSKVVSKKNSDLFSRLLQSPHCVEISQNVSFGIFIKSNVPTQCLKNTEKVSFNIASKATFTF